MQSPTVAFVPLGGESKTETGGLKSSFRKYSRRKMLVLKYEIYALFLFDRVPQCSSNSLGDWIAEPVPKRAGREGKRLTGDQTAARPAPMNACCFAVRP